MGRCRWWCRWRRCRIRWWHGYHDQGRPLKKDYSRFKMLNFRILENELKHGHELKRTRTRTRTRTQTRTRTRTRTYAPKVRQFRPEFGRTRSAPAEWEKRKIKAHSLSLKIPKKLFFFFSCFPVTVYIALELLRKLEIPKLVSQYSVGFLLVFLDI